jgi:DNA mismatch endonuclease, patch repair protein
MPKRRLHELEGTAVSKARSELMSRIRGKNTSPEITVRKVAHRLGFRFRLHRKALPGCPDLVFPAKSKAIFVHGCFWHRHIGCKKTTHPKTRFDFWAAKFSANIARDAENMRSLQALGWQILVIWECETFNLDRLAAKLISFLEHA